MESQRIDVNGKAMRWIEEGEGPPVVFIHGIPTSPALWRRVIPQVKEARCLAWEMVGYGTSIGEGRGRDLSVARQAGYLASWMKALSIEGAVLVGHDLGGGVAQIAAVRYPERAEGLVLTNSICYDSWPIPSVELLDALGPLVARLPDALLYPLLGLLFYRGHDDVRRAWESMRIHLANYTSADGAAALIRQIKALDAGDTLAVADDLPALNLPARLVWGAADPFQKIRYGERLARALGAPIRRIEGGRHFVPEDHPEAVAGAVNALLKQLTPVQ